MAARLTKKKITHYEPQFQQPNQASMSGAKQIQRMIKPKTHLWLSSACPCTVCQQQKPLMHPKIQETAQFKQSSKKSHEWIKKILLGLTQNVTKGLKIFIPDIFFVVGDGLEIFSTNKKDYRIIKFPGTTPIKAMVHTITRLRKQYKGMLQQSYKKGLIDKIDPKLIHVKYFDRLLPSHFHEGEDSRTLSRNKARFKSYILSNDEKFIIPSIQEHKMNEKQPFATIRYAQGNYQLLNQKQFDLFTIMKLPQDVVYIQSYVKSKQAEAIVFSTYTQALTKKIDMKLWKRAELYVMVLLGGLGKYDDGYDELENFQDETNQLMKVDPQKYATLITYQIVHFLSMASKIYISHIKIKWIINDIQNLYLQEIIEFQTDEISKRPIRYKLPPTSQIHNFYKDNDFFIQIHQQLKKKKEENLIKVKKQLQSKTYQEIINQSSNKPQSRGQQIKPQNSLNQNFSQMKNNIFKRLNNKRSISLLEEQSLINERNKMSIDTKDSTLINSSIKYSTIGGGKRSQIGAKNTSIINGIDNSRRSISVFGDVITRHEKKMIDKEKRKANKSINRYEMVNSQMKKYNPLDFPVFRPIKSSRATIDFS